MIWRMCSKHKKVYNWLLGCEKCNKGRIVVRKKSNGK